jgi:hypothetical protein
VQAFALPFSLGLTTHHAQPSPPPPQKNEQGYLDAAARMAAGGKRHLLLDSCDDKEDIQALLRHEIQVCRVGLVFDMFVCVRARALDQNQWNKGEKDLIGSAPAGYVPPPFQLSPDSSYTRQGMVRGCSVGRAIVHRFPDQLAMLPPWEIKPELSPTPNVRFGGIFA